MPGYGSPMAEVAGFEPTHTGVKVPCLTAWLHPSIWSTSRLDFHDTDCPPHQDTITLRLGAHGAVFSEHYHSS